MSPLQRAPVPASRASCRRRAAITRSRTSLRGDPALVRRADQIRRRHRLHLADEVDPVHERTAEAALVARELQRRAGAAVGRPGARAAVARRHHDRVRREVERALPARDLDAPLLERLPQGVDGAARELGQLVEEEDAPVRERDLAGHRPRAAPDEALRGDRVVRRAEGPLGREPPVADPGGAVHLGDLERLLEARRRQDSGEATGEHGLAGSGRADHEQVVPARGRDLERPLGVLLAAHVGEVGALRGASSAGSGSAGCAGSGVQRPWRRSASRDSVGIALTSIPSTSAASGRVRLRHQQPAVARAPGPQRRVERSPDRPQLSAQRELAGQRVAVEPLGRYLPAGREQARRLSRGRSSARPCARARARG